jgi:hypothetical protein
MNCSVTMFHGLNQLVGFTFGTFGDVHVNTWAGDVSVWDVQHNVPGIPSRVQWGKFADFKAAAAWVKANA